MLKFLIKALQASKFHRCVIPMLLDLLKSYTTEISNYRILWVLDFGDL